MEYESLLSGSRWELLEHLSTGAKSTSELAKGIGTSSAHVSQQLRQLELAGLIVRNRAQKANKHYAYSIKESFRYIVELDKDTARKQVILLDEKKQFLLALLLHQNDEALLSFILSFPEIFGHFSSACVLQRNGCELFVLTDNVDEIRQHFANVTIPTSSGEKKIIIWSHTFTEVMEGIKRHEAYYVQLIKDIFITYDPQNELEKLREGVGAE